VVICENRICKMRVVCSALVLALAFAVTWDPIGEVAVGGSWSIATSDETNVATFELHFVDCDPVRPGIVEVEDRLRTIFPRGVTVNNPDDDDAADVVITVHDAQYMSAIKGEFLECGDVQILETQFMYDEMLPTPNQNLMELRNTGTMTRVEDSELARRRLGDHPTSRSWEQHASKIRNQISGTCAAYSSAALMEIKENMDYGKPKDTYLSPLSIYVRRANMPRSGMHMGDVFQILRDFGAAMESDWPMDGFSGSQVDNTRMSDLPQRAIDAAKRHRVEKVYSYTPTANTADNKRIIIAAFNEYGPAHVACAVYGPSDGSRDPEGMCRMWVKKPGYGRVGGHAMAAVAYDDEGIVIRNSWGRGWCRDGKTKVVWDEVKMFSDFFWWSDAPTKSCEFFAGDTGKTCWAFEGMAPTDNENAQCATVPCNYADKATCCRRMDFEEFGNGACASGNTKIAVTMHTAASTAPCQKACQESEQCIGYSVSASGSQCGLVLACAADVGSSGIDGTVGGGKCFKKPGITEMPTPEFTKHSQQNIEGWSCDPADRVECNNAACVDDAKENMAGYDGFKVLDGGANMGGKYYYWRYRGASCIQSALKQHWAYTTYLPTCQAVHVDTSVTRPDGNPVPTQGPVQTQTPVTQRPTERGRINCGSSYRNSCADCAGDFGSLHCGGDCTWDGAAGVCRETATQRPATQAPVTQRPATQAPVTQRPATQAPVTQRPATQAPVTQAPTQGAGCDESGEGEVKNGQLGGRGYTCQQLKSYCRYDNIFRMLQDDCANTCANVRGDDCPGAPERVDCQMSAWTNQGECTASCDGGRQRQTRAVERQASGGGSACGASEREIDCNSEPCPAEDECKDFATTRAQAREIGPTGCLASKQGWDDTEYCGQYGKSTCTNSYWGPAYTECCPVWCGACSNDEVAIADIVKLEKEKPDFLADDVTSVSPFFAGTHAFALIGLGATAYVAFRACRKSSYKEIVDQEV